MKLIVLYGPPAAGKYTIAKAVSERTGYKLFHNHLTVDLLRSVFEFGTPHFLKLNRKIRLDVFEEAAKAGIPGIIFTFVYKKDSDDDFIRELENAVASNGGQAIFIQIYCEKEELLKRVNEESREPFHKIKSGEHLLKILSEGDIISPIGFIESAKIDTTHLEAEESASKIVEIIKASEVT